MVGQKSAETSAQVHKVKTASVKKPAKIAKVKPAKTAALAHEAADRTITASIAPDAPVVGRTWNYEYSGSRGTITYNADGTSSFNEPGLRKGAGKWHLRNGEFCQSFSGIQEPCTKLRQADSEKTGVVAPPTEAIGPLKKSLPVPGSTWPRSTPPAGA